MLLILKLNYKNFKIFKHYILEKGLCQHSDLNLDSNFSIFIYIEKFCIIMVIIKFLPVLGVLLEVGLSFLEEVRTLFLSWLKFKTMKDENLNELLRLNKK